MGPTQPHSALVHAEKYRDNGETFEFAMDRLASNLSDQNQHFREFRDILMDMRFMPAGRIQAAVGSKKQITPYNCFVSATIHDSFVHGDEAGHNSIMDVATQAATTMRMGGGIGYDWSSLRPADDYIAGVQSRTDGPLAFMPVYDAVCRATSSAGNRRGAQMGVLRVDHPDIKRFITAKQPGPEVVALWQYVEALRSDNPARPALVAALQSTLKLTGFNLSVGITDEFMECLQTGRAFPLRFGGRTYHEVDPAELWELIMRSTWDWAEPGVLFLDAINRLNNLYYCETIAATNPCGEQPLPPHGACLLGSFNLVRYITKDRKFDTTQLAKDVAPVVRAMDNVIDYAKYPLAQQEQEAKNKRRMGLGVTGLANAGEALGYQYGTKIFLEFERVVLRTILEASYQASMEIAKEKGAFPLFDAAKYCDGKFIQRLPKELQRDIRANGIRNSHLTSIAPTGTISYCADNVSSGLEPVFMYDGKRKMNTLEGSVVIDVQDYGVREFGVHGKLAERVTAQEHVDVLSVASGLVDSAVSKTCNVAPEMPWEAFKDLYETAWQRECKGCTTFNPGGKRLGIFIAKDNPEEEVIAEGEACTFDVATGRRNCE